MKLDKIIGYIRMKFDADLSSKWLLCSLASPNFKNGVLTTVVGVPSIVDFLFCRRPSTCFNSGDDFDEIFFVMQCSFSCVFHTTCVK
jgi:hypothetical protein